MRARAAVRGAAAGSLAVLTALGAGWGSEHHEDGRALDVTVVAVPSSDQPEVTDEAVQVRRLGGRSATVQSTSTATSDCDGCTATATAVTVAYANGSGAARLDNVAQAWSTCEGCSSRTVSVQVVVLRRAEAVRAANRAFAANVACTGCTTSAVAYQLVVVSPRGRTFSRADLADLVEWARAQTQVPEPTTALRSTGPRSATTDPLDELEARAGEALGPVQTLRRDVDRSTGSP
jgi:hypothetical protein